MRTSGAPARLLVTAIVVFVGAFAASSWAQAASTDPARDQARAAFIEYRSAAAAAANDFAGADPCASGETAGEYAAATVEAVNYFRFAAGLPPTSATADPEPAIAAAEAAAMMRANGALTHDPPTTWRCYSEVGWLGASSANLSWGATGPAAVENQMRDDGADNARVGHRRWLLYPRQSEIAVANTDATAAVWVLGPWGDRAPNPAVVAWPPPGWTPHQLAFNRWSFSVNTDAVVDFAGATVRVAVAGTEAQLDVAVESADEPALPALLGDNTIVFSPDPHVVADMIGPGRPDAHLTVAIKDVLVDGRGRDYTYTVSIFDPN